ncbi:uncharacterized protein BDV17DRAFT_270673 [Aspergillus undulatus]|uniref:uncharacterized protein n=1 Tax=Aspergillus undulatus TaxID=1810928 RepID=UPI003CCCD3BD
MGCVLNPVLAFLDMGFFRSFGCPDHDDDGQSSAIFTSIGFLPLPAGSGALESPRTPPETEPWLSGTKAGNTAISLKLAVFRREMDTICVTYCRYYYYDIV